MLSRDSIHRSRMDGEEAAARAYDERQRRKRRKQKMRLKERKRRGKQGATGDGKSKGRGSGRGDADDEAMVVSTGFDDDYDVPTLRVGRSSLLDVNDLSSLPKSRLTSEKLPHQAGRDASSVPPWIHGAYDPSGGKGSGSRDPSGR